MPLYEFICLKCAQTFDELRSMDDRGEPAVCPNCGAEQTRRGVSSFAAFGSGERESRAVAGSSPCSECVSSPTVCAGCGFKQ